MTPADLRALGEALYGPEWQTPMADALGVAARTVRRWVAGDFAIPADAAADLVPVARAARKGLLARAAAIERWLQTP